MEDGRWREFFASFVHKAKRGANGWWNGFCPFHEDPETSKSPSFGFNANSGGWRCQGCGESGNAYAFLAKIEGRPFDRDNEEDVAWARRRVAERWPSLANGYRRKRKADAPTAAELQLIAEMVRYRKEMTSDGAE